MRISDWSSDVCSSDLTLIGLLLVDVDDFKQINDGHGHLAGDRVLQAVANELRAAASGSDIACRLGGDEFALLMESPNAAELCARAQQLVAGIRKLAANKAADIPDRKSTRLNSSH